MSCRWMAVVAGLAWSVPAAAQVVSPPPPAEYDAQIRYRIRAARNERIRQFLDMTAALERAGFRRTVGEEGEAADANAERLEGRLPSGAFGEVLRIPQIRSVLLKPADGALPDGLVPVRITLVGGLTPERQRLLYAQVRDQLRRNGFVENVGYDHRNFSHILGRLPAAELGTVLADIRYQPGGWLAADTNPDTLPEPLRSIDPIRLTEVLAEPHGLAAAAAAAEPVLDPVTARMSPDLRALLADEAAANRRTRLEVILFDPLPPGDIAWRTYLVSLGTVTIEGQAGQVITVVAPASAARQIAALPRVATVRLPVRASPTISTVAVLNPTDALDRTNLARLHAQNGRGQGIRLAIIDSDFAGLSRFLNRSLPPATKLLDLTAERNPNLLPDPIPADRPGRGTLAALAAARAAPAAEITLVRVADDAPYQILAAARAIFGDSLRSEAMTVRHADLVFDGERLKQTRERLNVERQAMAEDFRADEETQKRRTDLQLRLGEVTHEEQEYDRRLVRFLKLEQALMDLRGVSAVACNLSWMRGWPTDGFGPLAAYVDGPAQVANARRKAGPQTWLQSAGDTRDQAWAGPAWDADANGVLEFVPRTFPLPTGRWTRELNFVGWQPHDGDVAADLPAGARIRLALQWTEAQDPSAVSDRQRYRTPLNQFRPIVLRQRDPAGRLTATDDLAVAARADQLPMLIDRSAGGATFEHVVEWTVDVPTRYTVRVEFTPAATTAPPEVPTIPAAQQFSEVYPRLSVDVADAPSQNFGRPIFLDFRSTAGGVGTPGDARAAIVVGASDATGRPQSYSARGTAPTLALNTRPDLLTFDEFNFGNVTARGTGVASGFAGGTLAAMLSAGGPPSNDLKWLRIQPGGPLVVPPAWLDQLLHTTGLRERAAYLPSPMDRPRRNR